MAAMPSGVGHFPTVEPLSQPFACHFAKLTPGAGGGAVAAANASAFVDLVQVPVQSQYSFLKV